MADDKAQKDKTLQMFEELTDASGVPGNEDEARQVMKKWIEPYADKVEYDNIGSIIASQKGTVQYLCNE